MVEADDVKLVEITGEVSSTGQGTHELDILSFDIEARNPHGMPSPEEDEIIMIGVAGRDFSRVISTRGSPRLC